MAAPAALPPAMKTPPEPPATLPTAAPLRAKAIAPGRERLQSEVLVWGWILTALPLALLLLWVQVSIAWDDGKAFSGTPMQAICVTLLLVGIVIAVRAATPAAAAVGGVICFTMAMVTTPASTRLSQTALPALLALVVLTFAATRFGRARKIKLGLAESKRGRATSQIVANLGVASMVALLHGMTSASPPACLAVLAEATADTLASELGPLFHGRTLLLTTMRRVAPGTDGGVSLGGTLCGIAGAVAVIAVGVRALELGWLEANIAFAGAMLGFLADSVLGATLERRGWIGNDLVNFLATAVAGAVALGLGIWLIP